MDAPPSVFVTYSWEEAAQRETQKRWVRDLARRLRGDGVDVLLDQWEVAPGDQIPHFMEASRKADFVLVVCTPRYGDAANDRLGSVGYESDVMTAELLAARNRRKFIPVLRAGAWLDAAPTWLLGSSYIDLSGDPYSDAAYGELLDALLGSRDTAPPVGPPRSSLQPPPGRAGVATESAFHDLLGFLAEQPKFEISSTVRDAVITLQALTFTDVDSKPFELRVSEAAAVIAGARDSSSDQALGAWCSFWLAVCALLAGRAEDAPAELNAAFLHAVGYLEEIFPPPDWDARSQEFIERMRRVSNDQNAGGPVTLFLLMGDARKALVVRWRSKRRLRAARMALLLKQIDRLAARYGLSADFSSPAKTLLIAPFLAWARKHEW